MADYSYTIISDCINCIKLYKVIHTIGSAQKGVDGVQIYNIL